MWKKIYDLPFNIVNHQSLIINNFIYIIGGYKNRDNLNTKITIFRISKDNAFEDLTSCSTYTWNSKTDKITNLLTNSFEPFDCYGHTVVKWGNLGILFGGYHINSHTPPEIYLFVANSECLPNRLKFLGNSTKSNYWIKVTGIGGKIPGKRDGHSAVIHYNNMYLFGGLLGAEVKYFDKKLYRLNLLNWQWTTVYNGDYLEPLGRDFCSLLAHRNSLYLYGGRSDNNINEVTYNDIYDTAVWRFDLNSKRNRWIKIHPGHGIIISVSVETDFVNCSNNQTIVNNFSQYPFPRRSHMAAVFENEFIVFGGSYESDKFSVHFGDLWSFNMLTYQWTSLSRKNESDINIIKPPNLRKGSFTIINKNCALLIGGVTNSFDDSNKLKGRILGSSIVISDPIMSCGTFSSFNNLCIANSINPVSIVLYHKPHFTVIGSVAINNDLTLHSINHMFILQPHLSLYQESMRVVANTYTSNQLQNYLIPQKMISDIETLF